MKETEKLTWIDNFCPLPPTPGTAPQRAARLGEFSSELRQAFERAGGPADKSYRAEVNAGESGRFEFEWNNGLPGNRCRQP
jgi:hypothetical protein